VCWSYADALTTLENAVWSLLTSNPSTHAFSLRFLLSGRAALTPIRYWFSFGRGNYIVPLY